LPLAEILGFSSGNWMVSIFLVLSSVTENIFFHLFSGLPIMLISAA